MRQSSHTRWVLCTVLFVGWSLCGFVGEGIAQTPIATEDRIYDPKIATVLLYPQVGSAMGASQGGLPAQSLNVPIGKLDDQEAAPMQLEFDDLTASYRNFRAKILHCNTDWKRSVLNDIEFTYQYNDNPIVDYQISIGTKVPYYHYRYTLPRLKLPGNYVLVVFNENRPDEVLFTRRFRLYSQRVGVAAGVRFSTDVSQQFSDQQVDFSIQYSAYQSQVTSPQDDFRVIVRQNYRDDRTVTDLRPTNVRAFDQTLEYRAIDLRNTFPGGNEYRYFDTRTVLSRANYVERINRLADKTVAYVQTDRPRSTVAYTQFDDFNGLFVIDHRETGDGATSADYIETVFTLLVDELPNATVYANGAFNFWALTDRNQLAYDPTLGGYRGRIWLKQGVYNYNYSVMGIAPPVTRSGIVRDGNETLIEGDFSQTENAYEVFVYHRPPGARADQLIGYTQIQYGARR
ncbi:hypothetical protein FAES_0354 [Fibrella aestuarina BUZ 2]|uniref:Type 9 secretion system plug protein N-terminal domain-containing protein n=1 Tax=Fibrella aestuarina BUZ 2 TaxID=1166018 RepID=I0K2L4_9BACT|nr:DUF5103 domain-containing protein [Fibrella aestuarina]CCG98367.1 hypothetical protein FAES_0354 [Fibrella aestuarina BUZ 2]